MVDGLEIFNTYITNLTSVWNFLLDVLTVIFNLMVSNPILVSVLGLWVLDRIFGIFDLIKG